MEAGVWGEAGRSQAGATPAVSMAFGFQPYAGPGSNAFGTELRGSKRRMDAQQVVKEEVPEETIINGQAIKRLRIDPSPRCQSCTYPHQPQQFDATTAPHTQFPCAYAAAPSSYHLPICPPPHDTIDSHPLPCTPTTASYGLMDAHAHSHAQVDAGVGGGVGVLGVHRSYSEPCFTSEDGSGVHAPLTGSGGCHDDVDVDYVTINSMLKTLHVARCYRFGRQVEVGLD